MNKLILVALMLLLVIGVYGQDKTRTHNPYSDHIPTYNSYDQQGTDPGITPDPTAPPTPPAPIPIDGGASFLLAAGVGFGLRKLIKQKENTLN